MAVAYDAVSQSTTGTNPGTNVASFNWSHDPVAAPEAAVVFVFEDSATDNITGVTYGGVAMEDLGASYDAVDSATEPGRVDTYFLSGAALPKGTGVQTVEVSCNNNGTEKWAVCITLTGAANKLLRPTGVVLLEGDGAYTVQSVNDGSPGSNSLRVAGAYYGGTTPAPAGTGSTSRATLDSGNYGYSVVTETTAGQGARNVGFNNATSDDRAAVHFAVAELYNYYARTASDTGLTNTDSIARARPAYGLEDAGLTTVQKVQSVFQQSYFYDVAYSPGEDQWLAAGTRPGVATGDVLWTASDARGLWTVRNIAAFTTTDWVAEIARNEAGDVWVVTGVNGKIAYSSNGTSWTTAGTNPFSGTTAIYSVEWSSAESQFVAAGQNGELATSPDGNTWTARTSSFGTDIIRELARSESLDLWVAVGAAGKIATSSNGTAWSQQTSPFTTEVIYCVHWSESTDRFVCGTNAGQLAYSDNGTAWTITTDHPLAGSDTVYSIHHNEKTGADSLWVATTNSGKIIVSANGISWRLFATPAITKPDIWSAKFSDERSQWLIGAGNSGTDQATLYTIDGVKFGDSITVSVGGAPQNYNRTLADSGLNPFTTPALLDNFNRSDGSLGSNWGTFNGNTALQIYSNTLVGPASADGVSRWTAGQFNADVFAYIEIPSGVSSPARYELYTRAQNDGTGTAAEWEIVFNEDDGQIIWYRRYNNAVSSALKTVQFQSAAAGFAGYKLGMKTITLNDGDTVRNEAWVDFNNGRGWTFIDAYEESTSTRTVLRNGGYVAVGMYGGGFTSTTRYADNFGAQNLFRDQLVAVPIRRLQDDGLAATQDYQALVLADTPLAFWRLDGASRTDDETANNYNLTEVGTNFTSVDGLTKGTDGATHFTNRVATGYMELTDSTVVDFPGTASFSVEAWFDPSQVDSTFRRILSWSDESDASTNGYQLVYQSGAILGVRRTAGTDRWADTTDITVVPWRRYHVVMTYDGSNIRIYVDGVLKDTQADTNSQGAYGGKLRIAVGQFGANSIFGAIDDVAVYDRTLTLAEIEEHYVYGVGGVTDSLSENAVRALSDYGITSGEGRPSVLFADDFSVQRWAASSGSPTRVTSPVHAPEQYSLEINPSASSEYVYYSPFGGTPTRVVAGFWWRMPSLPGANATMIGKIDAGPTECRMRVDSSGAVFIAADGTPSMASVYLGSDLVAGTWYWIEMMIDKSANPWVFRARINGTTFSTSGAAAASNCGGDFLMLGNNENETFSSNFSYPVYATASSATDWLGPQQPADFLLRTRIAQLSDAGLQITESVSVQKLGQSINLSDTGLTQTDSIRKAASKAISDIGLGLRDLNAYGNDNTYYGITGADPTALDITGTEITVVSYHKNNGGVGSGNGTIVGKNSNGTVQYGIFAGDDYEYFGIQGTTASDPSPVEGVMHLAAGVMRGTGTDQFEFWKNKNLVATATRGSAIPDTSNAVWFLVTNGTFNSHTTSWVAIWDKALTPNEIARLSMGEDPKSIQGANLKGYWKMGFGSPVPDLSGNGNNITLNGHSPSGTSWFLDGISTQARRAVADTGLTQTDSVAIAKVLGRAVSDTGLTQSDSLAVNKVVSKALTDSGLGITDSLARNSVRVKSDTGLTQTDSLLRIRVLTKSDTGLSQSDVLAERIQHGISDTGLTQTDSIAAQKALGKVASDTGLTQTDTLARRVNRAASDTGLTQTDSVVRSVVRVRSATETGLSQTDSLLRTRVLVPSDTGLTQTDSIVRLALRARTATDTGLSQSDTLLTLRARNASDTGLVQTDSLSVQKALGKVASDTGLTQTDSLLRTRVLTESDTGLTQTDSLLRTRVLTLSDTGISQSDVLAERIQHGISDTGLTQTDSIVAARRFGKVASDTGLTQTDSLLRTRVLTESDTGLTQTDSLLRTRVLTESDTGLTQTDTLLALRTRIASDTGLTQTDSLVAARRFGKVASDTGLTQTDSLTRSLARTTSDTGLTSSDSLVATRVLGKTLSDTGLTQTDSLATSSGTSVSDNGLNYSDALARLVRRAATDTGLTQTDSLLRTRVLTKSDTGLSQSDTLTATRVFGKAASDTGLSQSDTLLALRARTATDTGLSQSDSLLALRARTASDTGLTQTDSISATSGGSLSDAGLTQTDSLVATRVLGKVASDTGLTQTDTLLRALRRAPNDNGLTQTDSLLRIRVLTESDTGLTQTDSLTRNSVRVKSDTGLTQTDSIARVALRARTASDTGLTNSDSIARQLLATRPLSTTGLTQTDAIAATSGGNLSDTGLSQTDSITKRLSRSTSDTGLSQTDSITRARASALSVTDSGLTGAYLLEALNHAYRSLEDQGTSHGETLNASKQSGQTELSDTALSFSDTLAKVAALYRSATDAGLSQTDTLQAVVGIGPTDVGLVIVDSLGRQLMAYRLPTDVGLAISETLGTTGKRTPRRAHGLPPHRSTASGSVIGGGATGSSIGSRARGLT